MTGKLMNYDVTFKITKYGAAAMELIKDIGFVLGAPDAEMDLIEEILVAHDLPFVYGMVGGKRCHPGNAYNLDTIHLGVANAIMVECGSGGNEGVTMLDHHNPGDAGYDKGPEEYLLGSSVGQLMNLLIGFDLYDPTIWGDEQMSDVALGGHRMPVRLIYTAAADHCLSAAYGFECFDIEPITMMEHRVEMKAGFRNQSPEKVKASIDSQLELLNTLDDLPFDGSIIKDARGKVTNADMPEAAAYMGVGVLYSLLPNTPGNPGEKTKVGLIGGNKESITHFMEEWGPNEGLVGIYGCPIRGYCGGYLE